MDHENETDSPQKPLVVVAPAREVKPMDAAPPTIGLTRARAVERSHRTGRRRRFMLNTLLFLLFGCGGTPAPAVPKVHDCEEAAYVDKSAATADRRIGFGTELGSGAVSYLPRCMKIAPGQSVTFVGNFSTHPLSPGDLAHDAGTTPNPIVRQETGAADYAVTFNAAGLYPYYCELHEPTMAGAIWVQR